MDTHTRTHNTQFLHNLTEQEKITVYQIHYAAPFTFYTCSQTCEHTKLLHSLTQAKQVIVTRGYLGGIITEQTHIHTHTHNSVLIHFLTSLPRALSS